MIWMLSPALWPFYKKLWFQNAFLDIILWGNNFWFPAFFPVSLIFEQPFCKDSFSLPLFVFLYICFFGIIAYQNSCHDVLRLCCHMSTKRTHKSWTRKKMYKMKIRDSCERSHTYNLQKNLGRHNARWEESWCLHQIQKEIELKMAAIKLGLHLTKWQGACSHRTLPWKGVSHFAVSALWFRK